MSTSERERDIARAQAVCQETQNKDKDDEFCSLYQEYHRYLEAFARRRLYHESDLQDVLQIFWQEIWKGAICGYRGDSSLKSFLTSILHNKIIDRNKKRERIEKIPPPPSNESEHSQLIRNKGIEQLITKALLSLADTCPEDAHLVRLVSKGLSYEAILQQNREDTISPDERQREINRLKTRYKRAKSKLRIILERLMQAEGMDISTYLETDLPQ